MLELKNERQFLAQRSGLKRDVLVDRILEIRRLSPFADLTRGPAKQSFLDRDPDQIENLSEIKDDQESSQSVAR